MSAEVIPSDVRTFLANEVRSLLALEMLLLLRADQSRRWGASEITRELRANVDWAETELKKLTERRLVEPMPAQGGGLCYRYAQSVVLPPNAEFAIGWLAAAYPARRFSIIQELYASEKQVVRKEIGSPIQHFADAFKIRKEPPNG